MEEPDWKSSDEEPASPKENGEGHKNPTSRKSYEHGNNLPQYQEIVDSEEYKIKLEPSPLERGLNDFFYIYGQKQKEVSLAVYSEDELKKSLLQISYPQASYQFFKPGNYKPSEVAFVDDQNPSSDVFSHFRWVLLPSSVDLESWKYSIDDQRILEGGELQLIKMLPEHKPKPALKVTTLTESEAESFFREGELFEKPFLKIEGKRTITTLPEQLQIVASLYKETGTRNINVLCVEPGIGELAVALAANFSQVQVWSTKENLDLLQNNLSRYQLPNLEIIEKGSLTTFILKHKIDAAYFDTPPEKEEDFKKVVEMALLGPTLIRAPLSNLKYEGKLKEICVFRTFERYRLFISK